MSPTLDEVDKKELEVLIQQYNTLREESMHSTNNRVQILIYGIASIAAITAGALTIENPNTKQLLILLIFSLAIPFVSVFILLLWSSEAMRAHRAGHFLADEVEPRINKILGRSAMTWETSLWSGKLPRDEMFGPSMATLAMLGLLAFISPPFGMIFAEIKLNSLEAIVNLGAPYTILIGSTIFIIKNRKKLQNAPLKKTIDKKAR